MRKRKKNQNKFYQIVEFQNEIDISMLPLENSTNNDLKFKYFDIFPKYFFWFKLP